MQIFTVAKSLPLLKEDCNNLEMSLVLLQRHFSEQFLRVTCKWLLCDSLYTQQTLIKYELYHKHRDRVPGLYGETLKRNCFPQRVHNQQSSGMEKQETIVHHVKCHIGKLWICLEGCYPDLWGMSCFEEDATFKVSPGRVPWIQSVEIVYLFL